ncbi:hypothetical protein [Deinococcus radiophilus]|uniref:Uncharacterized protein n=1 Tax=Deinococcus radiophilus TaxID=32062 RepID=A0A3S0IAJ7_9DEIO|nr:hypothetical protein [Deinococcus radiophilus]RTR29063.1 hypothetical protein EJ104_04255 [Deinococcus radiophilus]UFA49650.1 hypothetical protein LMT64_07020 [Deinococcus radiophilus]
MTQTQKPSISRDVHYVGLNGRHVAAKVSYVYEPKTKEDSTEQQRWDSLVEQDCVDVHAFYLDYDKPVNYIESVPYDPEGKKPHSWHWPERV